MTDVELHAGGVDTSDLTSLKVAELQALAAQLGLQGATKLRKGELVTAIAAARAEAAGSATPAAEAPAAAPASENARAASQVLIEPLIAEPASEEPHVGEPVLPDAAAAPAEQAPRRRGSRRVSSADGTGIAAATHVNTGATGVDSLIPDVDALLDSALANRESAAH